SGFKVGRLTEDDFRELDGAASATGRVVRSVAALVGRQNWTRDFKDFIRRVTAYEPYSRFISHHHALDETCTIHARSLPDGMLPHTPLNEFLLSRPWQPILQPTRWRPSTRLSGIHHMFKKAGLRVEENRVLSTYAGPEGSGGQSSITVVAHKDGERFICNPGGRTRDGEGETHTPRASTPPCVQRHVDAALDPVIGKRSSRAPAEGSLISEALTTFLIKRYTDRFDAVLTTDAAVDTTVCEGALKFERKLVALVPDFGKVDSVRQNVANWEDKHRCGEGVELRRLQGGVTLPINIPDSNVRRSLAPRVWVSRDRRPVNVPHSIVPREVAVEVAWTQPQHAPHVISPEQQVAAMAAKKMELEIKTSNRHGLGLFAKEAMAAGDAMSMDCFGSFVVHDSEEEVVSAINKDGVPHHLVTDRLWVLCTEEENSRPQAVLYMVPHQSCFLWYMNSSGSDPKDANVKAHDIVDVDMLGLGRQGRGGTEIVRVPNPAFEKLLVPSKVLVFRLSRDVKAGEELLYDYHVAESKEG
ncbi:unnamed protein product, partial [Ectocarpus sp. 12 AP-2014]